jgi:hypothetical protein
VVARSMRNQRKCKVDSLAKTKWKDGVFGNIANLTRIGYGDGADCGPDETL